MHPNVEHWFKSNLQTSLLTYPEDDISLQHSRFNSHDLGSIPTLIGHVVAFLDKMLYNDYLCLVA